MNRWIERFLDRRRHHPVSGGLEIFKYIGPGLLVTVGFIDPGNWASNLAAGAEYGYALLWMVTLSTVMLIVLQHNVAHLGIATGLCLAEAASVHLHPRYSKPILLTAMLASVSTSLAELLDKPLDVLFITTANTLDTVPRPLLDRMEIIELGSYTDEEKFMIAKDHLIPKQLKKHGLKKAQLRITDDAIRETISCYTRESGVRNLERCFGEICRKADMEILSQEAPKKITVTGSNLENYLGVRKFLPDRLPCTDQVGLVTGLAWTSVGGETLEVEVNVMDGSGKLELTGNLGDVMKESAHAALSYIRANAQKLGVAPDFYKTKDIHVHFPEGAVPKDGPSAGVTVCTAIVSALTGVSVRRDIAMTGEISLRGRVMRIGGLREKTMAALRHGVRTVIIPKDNERDLEEIDQTVRRQLNFISAQTMDTVLSAALNRPTEVSPTILTELPGDVRTRVQKPGLRQ